MERIIVSFWSHYHGRERSRDMVLPELFKTIAKRLENGETILVHCAAGIHRTGLATYGTLRMLGHSPETCKKIIGDIRMVTLNECGEARFNKCEHLFRDVWPDKIENVE